MGKNVKENILEMKNISELIVDFAYSALFLQDRELVRYVNHLHEELEKLSLETIEMVFKIKGMKNTKLVILNLINSIKDISDIAVEIANIAKRFEIPSIIKEILGKTEERVITAKVSNKSLLCNKAIGEVKVETKTRARIIGVKRKGKWLFGINKFFKIKAGDFLVAVGPGIAKENLRKLASGK